MSTTSVSSIVPTASTTTQRGMNGLSSEDFFKILVAELRQQDPLQPSKTSDMIGQVSQIRSIELSKNLTDALQQLSRQQRALGASELLGKQVTATVIGDDGTEQEVTGVVTGVSFDTDGGAVLELDTGQSVRAADVKRIANTTAAGQSTTTGTTAADEATTAADKAEAAKAQSEGLLPWLSLDAAVHL